MVSSGKNRKVIWYISHYTGGNRHWSLAREWVRQGYRVYLFTTNQNHKRPVPVEVEGLFKPEVIDGIRVAWVRNIAYRSERDWRRIVGWILFMLQVFAVQRQVPQRPDVVVVSSLTLLPVINAIWFKWRHGARFVLEIRDIWPLTLNVLGRTKKTHPFYLFIGLIEYLGYRCADHVVGTMPNLKEHVRNVTNRRVPVSCIPQGVVIDQLDKGEELSEEFVARYIPENRFIVGYAGSFGTANAIDNLLEAARIVQDIDPSIAFVLVGSGAERERYEQLAERLENVYLAPKIKRTQVPDFLRRCDVLFQGLHSAVIYRYGISMNKLMDYMSSGRPVIMAYDGYQSMLNEAGCGSFIPTSSVQALVDEILRYRSMSSDQLKELGSRGRDFVIQTRDFHLLAKQFIDIFEAV